MNKPIVGAVILVAFVIIVLGTFLLFQVPPIKTCSNAVTDLEGQIEVTKSCQRDADCVFTQGDFKQLDGELIFDVGSESGYAINKESLDGINTKIKSIRDTNCKNIAETGAVPGRSPPKAICKNNICSRGT